MFKEFAHSLVDTMEEIVYFLIGLFVTGIIIGELYMVWSFKLPLPQNLMSPFWFPIYVMIIIVILKQVDNMQEKAAEQSDDTHSH